MLLYELRKTLNRRTALLFLCTGLLCALTVWLSVTPPPASREELAAGYALYEQDPDEFNRRYSGFDLIDLHEIANNPELYALNRVAEQKKYIDAYPTVLGRVIFQAKAGESEAVSSYMRSYHRQVADRYETMLESVKLEFRPVSGWEEYLSSPLPLYFSLFLAVFLAADQMLCESESGMLPVVRTCKAGRRKTAARKMGVIVLFSALCVCFFSLETLALSAARLPFSGGSEPIQILPQFELCPLRMSVVGYAAFLLIFRILAVCTAALLTAAIVQKILSRTIPILLVGGLFLIGYPILQNCTNINNNPLYFLNLYTLAFTHGFTERYFSFNLFGCSANGPVCLIVFFALLCLALILLGMIFFCRGGAALRIWKPSGKRFQGRRRVYIRHSFLSWEFRKNLGLPILLVLAALFAAKTALLCQNLDKTEYADEAYHYYMNRLAGEVTPEKLDFVTSEQIRIATVLSQKESVAQAYGRGDLDTDAYRAFLEEYWDAYVLNDGLARVMQDLPRLVSLDGAHFVYDTGYRKLFSDGADLFLCCSVFLIAYDLFLRERRTGMDVLLNTAKRGKNVSFFTKLAVCAICTLCLCTLYFGTDLILTAKAFDLPDRSAILVSLPDFAGISSNISIGSYLILSFAGKFAAYLIFALCASLIFLLLKGFASAGGLLLLIFFLPNRIRAMGAPFGYADFTTLMSFSERVRLQGSVGGALLSLGTVLVALCLLIFAARRKYCA